MFALGLPTTFRAAHAGDEVRSIAFDPTGALLAVGTRHWITIWSAAKSALPLGGCARLVRDTDAEEWGVEPIPTAAAAAEAAEAEAAEAAEAGGGEPAADVVWRGDSSAVACLEHGSIAIYSVRRLATPLPLPLPLSPTLPAGLPLGGPATTAVAAEARCPARATPWRC